MFSGIVEGLEKPIKLVENKDSIDLTLPTPKGWKLMEGQSINVDGVCSTIKKVNKNAFAVFYMAETLNKTHLNYLKRNHSFNLERSLSLNSLIGGHLVSGHVDTTGKVEEIKRVGESRVVKFKLDPEFSKYLIYKGSICVNGVSLTVVDAQKTFFTVSLIPFTLEKTNLGSLEIGEVVNIEVDLMSKYMEKFLQPYIKKLNE